VQANNLVKINGNAIEQIVYKSKPVITLRMMDELHKRPLDTARKAFNRHKDHLIENEDFFNVPYEQWSNFLTVQNMDGQKGGRKSSMTFLSQTGYLLLVKSFTDALAWKIQRELVNVYFQTRQATPQNPIDEKLDRLEKLKKIKSAVSKQEYESIKADVLKNLGYREHKQGLNKKRINPIIELLELLVQSDQTFDDVNFDTNNKGLVVNYTTVSLNMALKKISDDNQLIYTYNSQILHSRLKALKNSQWVYAGYVNRSSKHRFFQLIRLH